MTQLRARLIAVTKPVIDLPDALSLVGYCARVSNPANQDNPSVDRLLDFCIRNRHWSVFQMVNALVEIEGPRDITRQFTRHESMVVIEHEPGEFSIRHDGFDLKAGGVQEFSQRYSSQIEMTEREFRSAHPTNRQSSVDDLTPAQVHQLSVDLEFTRSVAMSNYQTALLEGVAKECARVHLPEGLTMSRLYVNGNLRSWMHYLSTRTGNGTQLEHQVLARLIGEAIHEAFPGMPQ